MLKKVKYIIVALLFSVLGVFAQTAIVTGNISGLKDTSITIHYYLDTASKSDVVKVKNGKFKWEAKMPQPQKVGIMFSNRYADFFAEKGNIQLRAQQMH